LHDALPICLCTATDFTVLMPKNPLLAAFVAACHEDRTAFIIHCYLGRIDGNHWCIFIQNMPDIFTGFERQIVLLYDSSIILLVIYCKLLSSIVIDIE